MTKSSNPAALGALFPAGFQWGVGTAAYKIEGALTKDGRGPSSWDVFAREPGRILDGSTAEPATPVGTLFHWDLPAALQDAGGWMNRDTSHRFAEYAQKMGEVLGDRVKDWFTVLEPDIMMRHSHVLGEHAPGKTLLVGESLPVVHHLLLGHGLATDALRSVTDGRIGLTTHPSPTEPVSHRLEDVEANALDDALRNHLVPDGVLRGAYPEELERLSGADLTMVRDGDMEIISRPIDMLGLTYYHSQRVQAPATATNEPFAFVRLDDVEFTTMDWPIVPEGFGRTLRDLKDRYGESLPPLIITDNGCSMPDLIAADGASHDDDRIEFLGAYLADLAAAIDDGIEVEGYYYRSFMDRFEWDLGYTKRWGLVHVDFETQTRTPKNSASWYRRLVDGWKSAHTP